MVEVSINFLLGEYGLYFYFLRSIPEVKNTIGECLGSAVLEGMEKH